MNVTMFDISSGIGNSISAARFPRMRRTGLKSARDQEERRQKAQNQIAFWEKQKESLKNRKSDTLEDIAKKLDRFHSYESEIAAVKMQYNQEQMWHTMDEAKEIGEKIAEETEKFEPKTAEERREDIAEEALETDESKGEFAESIEAMQEEMEEMTENIEEMQEEMTEMTENMSQTMEEVTESAEETLDSMTEESEEALEGAVSAEMPVSRTELLLEQALKYKRIDVFI